MFKTAFGADNVRICEGDTVYHVETGNKSIVKRITLIGEICLDNPGSVPLNAIYYTHQEPSCE